MSGVKVAGAWKTPTVTYVKVTGSWKIATLVYVKVAGVWKVSDFTSAPATPTLTHTAYGEFTISNYDATLVYTITLVSGTGSTSRVGAVVTVTGVNSRFSITATYASGAPVSTGYFERMQYLCTPTDVFVSYIHAAPPHGISNYGGAVVPDSTWLYCTEGQPGEMQHQEGYNRKNATPSGYTDSLGEWWKVT